MTVQPDSNAGARDGPRFFEFVALMALLMSLVALSIDAILPALSEIASELGTTRANDAQLMLAMVFIGMCCGYIVYGPLSDSVGRKPVIYVGLSMFMVGSLLSYVSQTFAVMLVGRFLQGIGAAAPRILTLALIRDRYRGPAMARVMSFVMAIFILVPAMAPSLGQVILWVADWRAIFLCFIVLAIVALSWFTVRQPETLQKSERIPFTVRKIARGAKEVCTHPVAMGCTLAGGAIFGAFVGYLHSSQQIFHELYGVGDLFALYFALLSLSIGAASATNARLVLRFGMRVLIRRALVIMLGLSVGFVVVTLALSGKPPLASFVIYAMLTFFCLGILFGNFNAMAMEPMGHIAGTASAVMGFLATLISMLLGVTIGQLYNGTVIPMVVGFASLAMVSLLLMIWIERRAPSTNGHD